MTDQEEMFVATPEVDRSGPDFDPPTGCLADGCGGALKFDPLLEGETVGGLVLVGWMVCSTCGKEWHARRLAKTADSWRLVSSGRSVDADGTRIRAESGGDVKRTMARIARVPDLERALRQIASGCADPAKVAALALGVDG